MLIYGTLTSLLQSLTQWEGLIIAWEDSRNSFDFMVGYGVAYFVIVIFTVVLVVFTTFHIYMTLNALTTIEMKEKMTVKFNRSPYYISKKDNLKSVCGDSFIKCCLPLSKF